MTYMLLLNCALKLVEEIILYYDARSNKHKKNHRTNSFVMFVEDANILGKIKKNTVCFSDIIEFVPIAEIFEDTHMYFHQTAALKHRNMMKEERKE